MENFNFDIHLKKVTLKNCIFTFTFSTLNIYTSKDTMYKFADDREIIVNYKLDHSGNLFSQDREISGNRYSIKNDLWFKVTSGRKTGTVRPNSLLENEFFYAVAYGYADKILKENNVESVKTVYNFELEVDKTEDDLLDNINKNPTFRLDRTAIENTKWSTANKLSRMKLEHDLYSIMLDYSLEQKNEKLFKEVSKKLNSIKKSMDKRRGKVD